MALSDINTTPTKGMIAEAKKGLAWRKEFGRGGTQVGVSRARDIVNGKNLSISSIKRMFSFFSRHEKSSKNGKGFKQGQEGYPSAGRIAWALWGGDPGFSWSRKKVNEIKKEEDRNMSKDLEIRQFDCSELRAERTETGDTIVRGYAAVFNQLSEDLGGFKEKINNRAFDKVLDNDVVALLNHDNNIVFGRTSSGTLKLSVDERGLVSEIKMPNTQAAKDTIELMERGDISKMSFGFYVDKDKWVEDSKGYVREVKEVKRLVDVSLVTRPAYPQTSAAVRSLDHHKQVNTDNVKTRKSKLKLLKLKK